MHRIRILILLSPALAACVLAACKSPAKSADADATQQKHAEVAESFRGMMVPVHTPEGVFLIDRFEVSELGRGDFFPVRNQLPKTRLTPDDARTICQAQGKRLCTAYEWKNACMGTQRTRFGYGNTMTTGRCNVQSHALVPTGSKLECTTDAGAFDMLGNVMEWVDGNERPTAMGGSFLSTETTDCFTSQFFPSGTTSEQIGFRCCSAQEKQ